MSLRFCLAHLVFLFRLLSPPFSDLYSNIASPLVRHALFFSLFPVEPFSSGISPILLDSLFYLTYSRFISESLGSNISPQLASSPLAPPHGLG